MAAAAPSIQAVKSKCSFSTIWLSLVNLLYAILGICLIAMSAWGLSHGDNPLMKALPTSTMGATVTIGVFLLILAIGGIIGLKMNYKVSGRILLAAYALFMVVVMLMEFICAIILFNFVGKLESFVPPDVTSSISTNSIAYLVNGSYVECCCSTDDSIVTVVCRDGCWLPADIDYPCGNIDRFSSFLSGYVADYIQPVAAVTLTLLIIQLCSFFASCFSICKGRKAEKSSMGGALAYDGLYAEGESDDYSNYSQYVKTGSVPRPGSAAAAATGGAAPKLPGRKA